MGNKDERVKQVEPQSEFGEVEPQATPQQTAKPPEPEPASPTRSSSAKRPAHDSTKDAKRKKTAEKKSNTFQREWTDDDEIAILRGLIEYKIEKKSDPMEDLNSFHGFIKKDLHATDFTNTQLHDKIRKLKRKYVKNYRNGKSEFSTPHEQGSYDLSDKIW